MKNNKLLTMLICMTMLFGGVALASCGMNNTGSDSSGSIVSEVKTTATVKFDVNIEGYETNSVKDKTVSIGKRVPIVKAYVTGENPDNLQLYGWYTDKECTNAWDFKKDLVEEDMTLYAKWVEQYDVKYYLNGKVIKTDFAFKGDTLTEDATLVAGFKYLGTYLDTTYETPFDYTQAVSGDLELHIKRSEGIYMTDHVEEGEIASGNLSDYLVAYVGSYSFDEKGNPIEQEGWVDTYKVATEYEDETVEEGCTYVNFGYQPKYGDGFVELCLALDITQSQIIRIWFKNLGKADVLNMYFTALLDADNNIYSETGSVYTQDFCYPNYTGSGVGNGIELKSSQIEMEETAEWTYVDFNLYEVYKNGYSIWGTSAFLGSLRFQAIYKNTSEEDLSNVFLIKAIEGIPYEIEVEDSGDVKDLLTKAETTTPAALQQASSLQGENSQGLVFPKNGDMVQRVEDGALVYNTVDGLLFYAENEIISREKSNPYYGFVLEVPEGKKIDLSELTTLEISLKNYGYAEDLVVRVYNDIGIPVTANLKIAKQMAGTKTYSANLYGKYGMEGTLSKIEIRYNSVGVDNAILIENIQMAAFIPYDSVGLNLNDKYCFGLTSTDKIEISFDSNREGTMFNVSDSGASVLSSDKLYDSTSDGYGIATLQYYMPKDSQITAVSVEYKIDGKFTSKYTYQLNTEQKGVVNKASLPLKSNERGIVRAVRFTFEGTGKVLIKSIDYSVSEYGGLPFYQSYADVYNGWDWDPTCTYQYDSVLKASLFVKNPAQSVSAFSMYIGLTTIMSQHLSIPHTTYNVLATETTTIKVVYQNKTDVNTLNLHAGFARSELANPDESGLSAFVANGNVIDCNMADYEWSTLTLVVPADYAGKYLGKIYVEFAGAEIAIRAISIETGV